MYLSITAFSISLLLFLVYFIILHFPVLLSFFHSLAFTQVNYGLDLHLLNIFFRYLISNNKKERDVKLRYDMKMKMMG